MKPLSTCNMLVPRMCSMNNTQTKKLSVEKDLVSPKHFAKLPNGHQHNPI